MELVDLYVVKPLKVVKTGDCVQIARMPFGWKPVLNDESWVRPCDEVENLSLPVRVFNTQEGREYFAIDDKLTDIIHCLSEERVAVAQNQTSKVRDQYAMLTDKVWGMELKINEMVSELQGAPFWKRLKALFLGNKVYKEVI